MAKKRKRRKRRPRPAPPSQAVATEQEASKPAPARSREGPEGPPRPPWGSFPLSELVVLIGIAMLVAGLFVEPPRGPVLIGAGLVLGSLAGLEVSVREHFAGYRSHTLLLGGAVGVAVVAALFALDPGPLAPLVRLIIGAAATGLASWWFVSVFRRRSGGALIKVR